MDYTKRLVISLVTLCLMVVALGTSVFAWFTINTKAEANSLSGTAESLDGGLYIKLNDDLEWSREVSLKNIVDEYFNFTDVTTADGINMTNMDNEALQPDEIEGYAEFYLHFLTGSKLNKIYLESLEITDKTLGGGWIAEKDVSYIEPPVSVIANSTMMYANLSDAIRVSTHEEGSAANIFQKYGSDNKVATRPYDPVIDDGRLVENSVFFTNTTGFGGFALDYFNAIMGNSLDITKAPRTGEQDFPTLEDHKVDRHIATAVLTNDLENVPDQSFTNYTKIKVRIWLEGWDGEAFNAIHNGDIVINFNFKVKEI